MSEFKIKIELKAPSGSRRQTVMNLLLNHIEKQSYLDFTDLNEEECSFTIIYKENI